MGTVFCVIGCYDDNITKEYKKEALHVFKTKEGAIQYRNQIYENQRLPRITHKEWDEIKFDLDNTEYSDEEISRARYVYEVLERYYTYIDIVELPYEIIDF